MEEAFDHRVGKAVRGAKRSVCVRLPSIGSARPFRWAGHCPHDLGHIVYRMPLTAPQLIRIGQVNQSWLGMRVAEFDAPSE